ncbi:MAG: TonB-dependent receptor [Planctomycetota bacterium]|nr:MAG: TonB-dependent receptor [Planctomycetota bacterium]REJ87859.1 MAG: TonB-dependent receptor [Planctomycetota bacterium]
MLEGGFDNMTQLLRRAKLARLLLSVCATSLCLALAAPVFAQPAFDADDPAPRLDEDLLDELTDGAADADDTDADDTDDDEATAPPFIIEGEREPSPAADAGDGPTDFDFNPFDVAEIFPDLTQQSFDFFDGGSRGRPGRSLFEIPRAVDVVTQQDIIESNSVDLGGLLETTTGVLIQRTGRGQSSPFIRGLTGQQVLILVDGVRVTNATFRAGPNQYFNTIDPNIVERIDVTRGPGSVLYGGDALGGVINVITKKSDVTGYNWTRGTTVQRFSTYDYGYNGRLNMEGSVEGFGFFGGAGYANYNNLDIGGTPDAPPGFDPGGRQPASSWRYGSADIKFNYALNGSDEVIVALQHFEGEDIFRTDRFPANRETIFDPQQRDLFYVRYQGENWCSWLNTWQITGSATRNKEGRIDSNPIGTLDAIREFTDEQTGVTGVFGTDLGGWGWLTYGFDWYHDEIDSSIINPDADGDTAQFPDDSWYSRYGVYLQWELPITECLDVVGGVRYEHVTSGATVTLPGPPVVVSQIDPEYQDWIGSVGLTYAYSPCLNLVASISEGFRAPNLDDLAAINDNVFTGTQIPNPDLDPETSITYEVGAKYNGGNFRGDVYVWWTDLEDIIVRGAPGPGDLLERTNSDAFLQGVEASGEYLLPCCWSLYGNFWYTFGRDDIGDEPLSRIPPTQGIVGLRRRWNGGQEWFDVYAWLVRDQDRLSARDISDVNRIPIGGTPGYQTLNFRYGRLISKRQRISVNFENVWDEQYRVHGSGGDGPGVGAIVTYELLK